MTLHNDTLSRVRVAAPCHADWNRMTGTERVRHCDSCDLNVYNLSAMTRREAERFVENAEGRVCVRFYRRADGTILTENCPVGLRALKRRATRAATAFASAVLGFFAGFGVNAGWAPGGESTHNIGAVVSPVTATVSPAEEAPVTETMGDMNPVTGTMDATIDLGIYANGRMTFDPVEVEPQTRRRAPRRHRASGR